MEKYNSVIDNLNSGLKKFSSYLNEENYISLIDGEKLQDPNHCWDLKKLGWDETHFPNGPSPGVYLIFGYRKDETNSLAVYVGKASYNSAIGKRLYAHLNNPMRNEKIYSMRDKSGYEYILEFVATIPMDNIPFLAPALEEFLIHYLQNLEIDIMNVVGKSEY